MTQDIFQVALAAHQQGEIEKAHQAYRTLLEGNPDHIDGLSLFGVLLTSLGRGREAVTFCARAVQLDPSAALLHLNLGNAQMAVDELDQAAASFQRAADLAPTRPEPFYNLGNVLRLQGKWDEAEEMYRKALQIAPGHYEARNNLALVHEHRDQPALAVQQLCSLLQEVPHYGDAWLNLCKIAEKTEDFDLALQAGLHAVALLQTNEKAWFGLGVVLNRLGRDEEALEAYLNALRIKPDWPEVWDNLGQTYQFMNRLDEAEKAFRAAIEAAGEIIPQEQGRRVDEAEYGPHHWHLALLELLNGDLEHGFARYRARFKDVSGLRRPDYSCPVWQGQDLRGKIILVVEEQGAGDCLMLVRYLRLLKARGGEVWLLVHPYMSRYLQGMDSVDRLFVRGQDMATGFDFYASIFDLPYGFSTVLETVPDQVPYLPVPILGDDTRLEPLFGKKRIGVVWGGAPKHKQDAKRSIPLSVFSKIFSYPHARFYSLNRDKRSGDDALLASLPIVDLAPKLNDFHDAAAYISQMDLIITCDTATAHMAGGMNKPVWTLIPYAPDWRWLLHRKDTPWYPSMKLFRQQKSGAWEAVVDMVLESLERE